MTEYAIESTQLAGFDLPDPVTMAVAIDPGIATCRDFRVDVTTGDGLQRGITVVDVLGVTGRDPQMTVATSVDRAAFRGRCCNDRLSRPV